MIPTGEFLTHSAEETFELAYQIAESIQATTVFLLDGDLGAGKTVFAKGLAAGAGIDPADVTSPTFTLINHYESRLKLYHLDLYRLGGDELELQSLGISEMCAEEGALIVIEWPERLGRVRLPNAYLVKIIDDGGESRRLSIVKY
jgi:tRNA threonylcarbamoyladenosine biosynthesis protein TsaE